MSRYPTMKNSLLVFALISSFLLAAQQKQFDVKWDGSIKMQATQMSYELPSFEQKHFSFDLKRGIRYTSQWTISQAIDGSSVKLEKANYSTISKQELKDLPLYLIPKEPVLELHNSVARSKRYAHVEISPIIVEDGIYKKLMSFTISYSSDSRNRVARRTPPISNSVLSDGEWKKFYVEESGVVKLSKQFLNSLGLNTSGDPRFLKIYGNGGKPLPMLNSEPYPF